MAGNKNYFELLELASNVTNRATIEAAIKAKEEIWSSDSLLASGVDKARARANYALVEDIRKVMLTETSERRKMAKEWAETEKKNERDRQENLQTKYDLLSKPGYLLKQDYQDLAHEFTEVAVKRVVRVPVVDKPPEAKKTYMDARAFRAIVEGLEHISKRDLYELQELPSTTPTAAILESAKVKLREHQKKGKRDHNHDMQQELLQKCLAIFKTDAAREAYDHSLKRLPVQRVLEANAKQILKNHGRFDLGQIQALVKHAVGKGIPEADASEYLQWMQEEYGGKAGALSPADKPQKCLKCQHENAPRADACAKCGTALLVSCPKCDGKKPVADAACTSCGYSEKDAEQFRLALTEARDRLGRANFAEARNRLFQARRLLPDSEVAQLLGGEIDDRELDALLKLAQANLDNGKLAESAEALTKASALRPDDPRLATLRKKYASRSSVKESLAALVEAIREGRHERRILQAWDAVVEGGGQDEAAIHGKRVELARRRVKALELARLTGDFQADTELVRQLKPLIDGQGEQSLKLESCHDPDILKLTDQLARAQTRLEGVEKLRQTLDEANRGQATEAQIAHAGRTLDSSYHPALFDRVQLAIQLTKQPPDHAEIAGLWERASDSPFCPKHPATLEQCQRIARTVQAGRIVNGLASGVNEQDDRLFLEAFETHDLGRADDDGRLTQRQQQTRQRIAKLDGLQQIVDETDAGRHPETAIVTAASEAGLPSGYSYRLSGRVELARALAETPRSDRRISQTVARFTEADPRPRWPATMRDLQLAEQRTQRLNEIIALPPNLAREDRDAALVKLWNGELLDDCADARVYLPEVRDAEVRQKTWTRITDLLDHGGDPRGIERKLERVEGYGCYTARREEIEKLIVCSQRVTPMLDALDDRDDQTFVKVFDPKIIQAHPQSFADNWTDIERIVRESMSNLLRAVPSEPAWSWDHDGQNVRIHWTIQPREYTTLSAVATNDQQFYRDVSEARRHIREVNATAVRGFAVRSPRAGEKLFVTIWPMLAIGEVRLYGAPECIGPIEPRSLPDAPRKSVGTDRWSQLPRRMLKWLAGIAKRI